jgi:hypothetical protein
MNTATVTTTAATVSPFIQNLQQQQPQKPQTSKEAIAANVKALIEQLEEGHSEGLTAYLTAMGRFHNYSFGNILEIARQKPSATRVAGMYAWNQLGRRVNKGEKGIRILAPMTGVRRKKDAEAAKDVRTQNQSVLVGFRSVYVFDVTQTEGLELSQKVRWRHRGLRIWVQREWGHRGVQMSKPPGAHSRRKRRGGYGLHKDR